MSVKGVNPLVTEPRIQVSGWSSNTGADPYAVMSGWTGERGMRENTRISTSVINGDWGWWSECDREPDSSDKNFNLFIYKPPAACVNTARGSTCPDNMDPTLKDMCNFDAPVWTPL